MLGKTILLIVGGGIAAYKSCELVRLIRRGGASVRCVLTKGGEQFVTPMTLAALSSQEVFTNLWSLKDEAEMGHIQLSRDADLVVVCPASADLLARMATGMADDLATTLLNAHYDSYEAYVFALSREIAKEYELIARDFILQIDAPDLALERTVLFQDKSVPEFIKIAEMHVAVNMTSGIRLADTYRKVYGTLDGRGLPVVRDDTAPTPAGQTADADLFIDQDIAIGTPIWHDWAKTIVFQWNADGSEYIELNFGGNGKTDAWGAPGNTKTSAHHMIGIAEGMARGMPPAFLIAHASAHGAPNAGNEFSVVNWLRTAGIMTGIDPVERGYLVKDAAGRLRIAPVRNLGSVNILASLPNQSNLLYEYVLQNLSDADYTYTGPAVVQSELLLRVLAPKFGYDPADATRYNTAYRNPVLTHLSAERVHILYATGGIGRVEAEVGKLKAAGLVK